MVALLSSFLLSASLHSAEVPARSVSLSWNPNPESNVAGYKVRFGTASGAYSDVIDTGRETSAVLPQMILGRTYYMTVSAYDTAGRDGTSSAELVVTPALPQPVERTGFSLAGSGRGEIRWEYPNTAGNSAERFTIYSSENLADWTVAGSTLPSVGTSSYSFPLSPVPGKLRMFYKVGVANPFGESP